VNEEANQGFDNLSYCESVTWLTLETKRYMGCPDPTKPEDVNKVVETSSLVIETQNDVEDKWLECINTKCEAHAAEIRAEILAEKQRGNQSD
jgi:hypothetical protein